MKEFFLFLSWIYVSFSSPINLETRLGKLEESARKHERENVYLKETVSLLKFENSRLSNRVNSLILENSYRGAEKDKRLLHQGLVIEGIGFYAYMSRDEPDPRGHHTLVYDVTQTNLGNGYNKDTGVFIVPRDGLYSFTWSTRVECHLAHTTDLVINAKIMGSTYAFCGYNTVTGHVVAAVAQGDVVFVRTHSTSPGQGAIKSNEFGRSAFSGFLIE
ncbi:complement C1q-like protein 3 [Saccostrea echinata]|uniref:complement C1q-like protein 3 n=1 Tax=Saccostrea echinata TaxID=191078 RepID=UPI002A82A0AF|nr:complement C1q-like protein 3 [Saccostrea echinata]